MLLTIGLFTIYNNFTEGRFLNIFVNKTDLHFLKINTLQAFKDDSS